ncbi:zinc-dependent alcohol dehydrogenase family protein [Kitasatospora sp. NPDC058170]|uniref:zinc-dependent alcohol dehydrogenase family protein n=1 Tax=Kitasatospora sp. NPDC058170 TaxID=3346364 RepID=UPI0036D99DB1
MARAVLFDRIGGPEVLAVHDVQTPAPGAGELRIKVEAIGLNRAEVLFRTGTYLTSPDLPSGLGCEAVGTVDATGPGVEGFAPGDRVDVLPLFSQNDYPTYGDLVLVPAAATVHRPPGLDPVRAAALWMPYLTAYGALAADGHLRPGDHALITAASSSVGLAAIRTARHLGAVPIATTRTRAKRRQLLDAGAAHVIVTGEQDLPAEVAAITGGRGARTAFDPVSGPGVEDLARALAPGGALIVYGRLDPRPTPLPGADTFAPITSRFYTVFEVAADPERLRRAVAFITAGLRAGTLAPLVDRVFDGLDDIADAHRYLESNAQVGKIVVTVRP